MADLDRAVGNVLRLEVSDGLVRESVCVARIGKELVHSKEHKELARQVAREGVVR